ncbi:hypothetical protein Q73_09265 [Bacillus coahuilensis m2-6]|uniref:Prepilin-type N-terminal cleavage/methylation domain-containing protein n=1 Tax=Bacillus coahuilensis p1.1.43 TaxID=1150625 RepID=A0A147K7I3_9BACI|nr:competence type IV pilus minor pilin ComGD [Bacillus coahuilensis]KUP05962.1 hypothetical protein Q75_09850 [Bacillus coahuilensis p1.1.43]KUP07395.1 hypothetical protein Q73_09265 [Bacillus coahuilensis m2-6]
MSKKGFTYIELLLVLVVFSIFLSLGIIVVDQYRKTVQSHSFLKEIESDLYSSQVTSINRAQKTNIQFLVSVNRFVVKNFNTGEILLNKPLPHYVKVDPYSSLLNWSYTKDGTVDKFGTLKLYVHDQPYYITVQIGHGRHLIYE